MLKKLLRAIQKIASLSTKSVYQRDLEQYIISKRPTTVAEVEHWIKTFDQSQPGRYV